MLKTKLTSLLTAAALMFPMLVIPTETASAKDTGTMRNLPTMEIVNDMGLGINLGNTFESSGDWIKQYGDGTQNAYETAWGSPTITQNIIQGYADEGFGVLRVPVAWSNMMSEDGTYTINSDYMDRVHQVIDWALDTDMYVIMNLHWDGGWLENLPNDHDNCMRKYSVIWTQLCDEFGDYGDKLIFESQNEELYWQNVWNQWGGTTGKDRAYGYCNEVNQTFVDIVRKSGGNNAKRHLLIAGYNTDVKLTCDPLFKMPSDPAGRCAVSVHYYIPSTFAILEEDAEWGKSAYTWGTAAEYAELNSNMDLLKTTFVDKGIPVIIGEYGCPRKNKEAASVTRFLSAVAEQAVKRGGICPVLWDITDLHYDRKTCKLKDTALKANYDAIRNTYFSSNQTTTESPATTEVINGTLIKNLIVADTENAADWSIQSGFSTGSKLYGDRDITAASSSMLVNGAEYIRTACDSKMYIDDLATFEAGADMYVFAAVDKRVDASMSWLENWTNTGSVITSSNGVAFTLYQKQVKSDEKVTLGTNGGQNESANYIVFASTTVNTSDVKGDVNSDGMFNVSDVVLLQKWLLAVPNTHLVNWKAADLCEDGKLDVFDLCMMKRELVEKTETHISPEEYMAQVSTKILNSDPSGATAENAGTQYGTYEKVSFTSAVCGGRTKSFNVLLPAGYSTSKKYPVLYVMHGYWGDEDSLLDKGDASLRLRQIIGNAIASGEAEDMIVVFPDIYASATQDKCDGLNDKNNAAYDNFINELTKEIMPYMEQHYSIKTGRDNTAITGFSMGGRESLYIGLTRPDLFGYIGAMCPAPGVPLSNDKFKFGDIEPYLFFISAGSNDTLIYSTPEGYHNTLTANGTTHIWHYVNGGDHGGKTIRPHMYNFIRYIFKA